MYSPHIRPVSPEKVYRLLNTGATTLISASADGVDDVMAAAWATALGLEPPTLTVVIDRPHFTRRLIEKSGYFALQLPTEKIVRDVMHYGSVSKNDDPEKLTGFDDRFFRADGFEMPLVKDCAAWLICRVVPEARNEEKYDLYIGEVVAAWADDRVFSDGHWHLEDAAPDMATLHYVAGGHFYALGRPVTVPGFD